MIEAGAETEAIAKKMKEEKQNARLPLGDLRLEKDVLYKYATSLYEEKKRQ